MNINKLPQFTEKEAQRFWAKVDIQDEDKCWNWLASLSTTGYGQVVRGKMGEQKSYRAHRIAYFLYHGIDPIGYILCHTCANPLCCNPLHAYMGTHTDNMYDAFDDGARKPRQSKVFHHLWKDESNVGEKHHNAKLDAAKVRQIRQWHKERVSEREIARRLGVGSTSVGCVVRGQTWKHIE